MALDPDLVKTASKQKYCGSASPKDIPSSQTESVDAEKGAEDDPSRPEIISATGQQINEDLDLYSLMKDTVNYTSIDQTERGNVLSAPSNSHACLH
jgi:hypothetical protein